MKEIKYIPRHPRRPGLKKEFGKVIYVGNERKTCYIRIPKWLASLTGVKHDQRVRVISYDDTGKRLKLLLEVFV